MKHQGKEFIGNRQFMFSIICFIQSSSLLTSFVISTTKQDTWFAVLMSIPICVSLILMYMTMAKWFPGKNLIDINIAVFGKVIGKVVSAFYLFFFLSIAALNSMDMGNFVTSMMMPETPAVACILMFIFICAMAVRKGINVIARFALLFLVIVAIEFISTGILLIGDMETTNFQPSFTLDFIDYVHGTHIISMIPFGEIVVFMMIVPKAVPQKKVLKSYIWGFLIGLSGFLFIILRDWAVAGNAEFYMTLPSFQIVRIINFAEIFTRMEVLYAILITALLFFKVSIFYYATVLCIAQLFELDSYEPLTIVVGILIVCYSLIAFTTGTQNEFWGVNTAAFFNTFFVLVLPFITFATGLIKKQKNKLSSSQGTS